MQKSPPPTFPGSSLETPLRWLFPLPGLPLPSADSDAFRSADATQVVLPLPGHSGSFGHVRRNHVHEGIDLHAPEGTSVSACADGTVASIEPFTGPDAGSPWWLDTLAVFVDHGDGTTMVYGEIQPCPGLVPGAAIRRGEPVGTVRRVLRNDKGRPTSMLHLELRETGAPPIPEWPLSQPGKPGDRPRGLLDPTGRLSAAQPQ